MNHNKASKLSSRTKSVLAIMAISTLFLGYQNCGNKVDFKENNLGSSIVDTGHETPTEIPNNPQSPELTRISDIHDLPNNKKVDILFVIDNSGSMKNEQAEMANRFSTFVTSLSGLDYHVGITTTDVSKYGVKGSLLRFDQNLTHIDNNTPNAQELFGATIQRPEEGSGDERGIYAANLAIQMNENSWIRSDAHLAVVVVSDEDERSNGTNLQDLDKPESFHREVKGNLGENKNYSFHAIIADQACVRASGGNIGNIYNGLANDLKGIVGNICSNDYSSQLTDIGTRIQTFSNSIQLKCAPYEGKVTVKKLSGEKVLGVAEGTKFLFAEPVEGGTRLTVEYSCLK